MRQYLPGKTLEVSAVTNLAKSASKLTDCDFKSINLLFGLCDVSATAW